MSNDCEKVSYTICGHNYQFWCKKDKVDDANYIVSKISQIIEKNNVKNTGFSFDKILFMSLIDILTNDKKQEDKKEEIKEKSLLLKQNDNYDSLIGDFVEILEIIKKNI